MKLYYHPVNVSSYFGRLLERPSFQKVLKEAAPHLAAFAAPSK